MKFPAPKTMSMAILPTLLFNWIFGIGVIEYPLGKPRRIASAFWSFTNLLIYFGYLWMANVSETMILKESKVGSYSYRLVIYLESVFIATSMCLAQMRAKVIADAISNLTGINDRLDRLGIPNDYDGFFRAQVIQLGGSFATISTLMVLYAVNITTDYPAEAAFIGYSMASYYWVMIAFIVDYTFSSTIRYVRNRFERLNAFLVELDLLTRCGSMAVQSDGQFPYFSVIREIHGSNPSSVRVANKQWLLCVIRGTRYTINAVNHICRKIHRGLCNITMEWNRAFGIQLLFSVSLSFGLLTSLFYTFYTIAVEKFSDIPILSGWTYKIFSLMWITYYATKVILIVDACETTSREAIRTRELINKILETPACDEDIRKEIDIFSLQLLQSPLKFTAHGFFTLNYSLVHEIIGSATTYLIIMIQMRSIYDVGNVKFTSNSTILIERNATN